jgi:hypothetical protein
LIRFVEFYSETMTLSQYLGRGSLSRGRATIKGDLSIGCSDPANFPYLKDQYDIAAVVQGIKNVQKALNTVKNLTFVHPPPGQTVEDYVASVSQFHNFSHSLERPLQIATVINTLVASRNSCR